MKIGDIFKDGDYTYKVIAIHESGMPISKRVDNEKIEIKAEAEEVKYTKTQINRMALNELGTLCNELGIEANTGTEMKKAIIEYFGL